MKADKNTVEQAYAFFHQKLKVYEHSTSEREMDHIEDCIADYANTMSKALFNELSQGNPAFLHEHTTFQDDLRKAVCEMEKWIGEADFPAAYSVIRSFFCFVFGFMVLWFYCL